MPPYAFIRTPAPVHAPHLLPHLYARRAASATVLVCIAHNARGCTRADCTAAACTARCRSRRSHNCHRSHLHSTCHNACLHHTHRRYLGFMQHTALAVAPACAAYAFATTPAHALLVALLPRHRLRSLPPASALYPYHKLPHCTHDCACAAPRTRMYCTRALVRTASGTCAAPTCITVAVVHITLVASPCIRTHRTRYFPRMVLHI